MEHPLITEMRNAGTYLRRSVQISDSSTSEEGIITGYASIFGNVDSYGTVFVPGAFQNTLATRFEQIKILWNHDCDKPIGKLLQAYEDSKGLFVQYKLSLGVQYAQDIYTLIKDEVITCMSFGFNILDYHCENGVIYIDEVDLFDISPVTFPANSQAEITGVRSKLLSGVKPAQEDPATGAILLSIAEQVRKVLSK